MPGALTLAAVAAAACVASLAAASVLSDQSRRNGKYREGYLEVMRPGPVPDLRKIPDCPRKTVDDRTMAEHRNCFKASAERIRVALRHGMFVFCSGHLLGYSLLVCLAVCNTYIFYFHSSSGLYRCVFHVLATRQRCYRRLTFFPRY